MSKKSKKKTQPKFNYAVGQYWEGDSGAVGCYMTYSNVVHFGTLKEAKAHRDYCINNTDLEDDGSKPDYRIFMLVEVPV